ncbi:DUF938 domain-containing protein [Rhodobacterales bacterium LSUCC0031]|nr:DUF938 domain-containing protein [Rhodobacterales bacterium LSUCC0031]
MIRKLDLPDGAAPSDTARLSAPSALRNRDAITAELTRIAPASGRALEIASGTGEHVIRFAAAMPGLTWQPSDPDPTRRGSIAAWTAAAGLPNIRPPLALDAAQPGWAARHGPTDLIVLVNLLHLICDAETKIVLTEVALALAPGGQFALYGPFLRDGAATSDGDAAFHASLRAQDAAIGYKDMADVILWTKEKGMAHHRTIPMPANNLLLVFRRPV